MSDSSLPAIVAGRYQVADTRPEPTPPFPWNAVPVLAAALIAAHDLSLADIAKTVAFGVDTLITYK